MASWLLEHSLLYTEKSDTNYMSTFWVVYYVNIIITLAEFFID